VNKKKNAASTILAGIVIFSPWISLAAGQQIDNDTAELYTMVGDFYQNLLLPIGSILAGFVIMIGGIMYAISAGDASKVGKAKELIVGAISGEALLLCAWAIVKILSS